MNVSNNSSSIVFNISNSPTAGINNTNYSNIYVTADVQHLFTQMASLQHTIAELQTRIEKIEKGK